MHPSPPAVSDEAALQAALAQIVGPAHVLTEPAQRQFHATDLAAQGCTPCCVVAPGSTDELARTVALATGAGYAVVPKGGGYSYTGGYRPVRERSVTIDLRRLDRIVEINTEDLYVTVQAGCTWRTLYEALKDAGYRTPYFGPMSGYWATVGGALSQGSFFLGSSQHGVAAESVLSLEVVLADGSVVNTGSAGSATHPSPFFRWYGPDLSGLFLGDTGALGFKTQASLKLIPWPKAQRYATFALDDLAASTRLVSEIGRLGLAAECYCWDPTFVKSVGERSNLVQDLKYLKGVVGSGSSLWGGLRDAAKMALAGKRVFDGSTHLVHVTIDDRSAAGADARLAEVREIAARCDAGEVAASAPRATRAMPFMDFKHNGMTSDGIRNLPTNALVPHSRVQQLAAETDAFFKARQALFAQHGLTYGVIVFAVGSTAMCIEPLLYFKDPQHLLHDRISERSDLAGLAGFDGPVEAARVATQVRKELVELFASLGTAHVQIGKSYPWLATRQPDTARLIHTLKQALDPQGLVNPGSLGLGQA